MERAQGPAGLADGLRRNKTCEIPMASAVCGAGRGRPQAVTDPRSRPRSAARSTKRRASTGVGLLLPAAYAAASHSPIGCPLTEFTFDWGKSS